jgi:radical SAM enzyme (TIGR01210 family)
VATAAIFLTNRECPWRCVMCDLWRSTLTESVPPGAIPRQIDYAFEQLGIRPGDPATLPRQVKLYNAGSFFDPRAIPPADYGAIANRVRVAERVIVECHPALVGEACVRFRDMLVEGSPSSARLEVALGLETAHPGVLARLNKRMTLDQFRRAAEFLHRQEIALRVFVLVKPPFLDETAALEWAERSIDFAFGAGATAVSLIPTRGGNGALDALERLGQFAPPKLCTLESAQAYGIGLHRGRVFADLWDLERFSDCAACFEARRSRLHRMNLEQVEWETIRCSACADRPR